MEDDNFLKSYSLNPATLLIVTLLHGCFPTFLKFRNGIKWRKHHN